MSLTDGVLTALPAPPGYVVDFDNPHRNSDIACYWVVGVGSLLSVLFMGQRFYVNAFVKRSLRLDDACLFVAWIFCITIQVLIVQSFVTKMLGVHGWEMPFTRFAKFVRYNLYLFPILYATPTALAKLVLLLFYRQLQNQQPWFRWATWAAIFITIGSNTGIFFSAIFACSPIRAGWDITILDAKCINRSALFQSTAILGVVTDVLIILIPIPMIIKLHMSRAKKVGLLLMFTVGSATVITSIVRLVLLITILTDADQSWGGGPVCLWICVEANLLIMCASLPTLRLFFRTVAPNLMSSSGGNSKTTSGQLGGTGGRSGYANGIKTIGGSGNRINPRRQHYGRFDDDEYHMETLVTGGPREKNLEAKKHTDVDTTSSREWEADGTSETGIVQTKTTHVYVEER